MLSRKEEFIGKKLHDIMILRIILYYNDSFFIKDVKKTYRLNEDVLKIKKEFS